MAIKKPGEGTPTPDQTSPASVTGSSTPDAGVTINHDESYTQKCIRRSGLIQAAMISPGVAAYSTNWADFKEKAKELAMDMLKVVENH